MAPEVMQAGEEEDLLQASESRLVGGEEENERQRKYGRKADIWSLGMTLCELANGDPPFKNAAVAIYAVCVSRKLPSFPEAFSDFAHSFLANCLVYDPRRRANCEDLLQHPFMQPKVRSCSACMTCF